MRRAFTIALLCGLAGVAALVSAQTSAGRTLDIYYIDTEGGQSTLFVSPTGESLLVDTGNAGARDLDRIVAALAAAGVKQIDHMWTTHYHGDHVGAMEELAKRVPIKHFYDHGPMAANDRATPATFLPMYEALSKGHRTTVKPGDKVPMAGLDIITVSSNAVGIKTSLPGAGKPNPACAGVEKKDESAYFDPDNGSSAGFAMTFGKFRTVDLGDLTWNGELDIMCPVNRIGKIDLYLVSHHGIDRSNSPRAGARPAAARGDHEQRHPEGRRARHVQGARDVAGTRGSLAAALVVQRRRRAQRARRVHRKHRRQRDHRRRAHRPAAGAARRGAPAPQRGAPEHPERRAAPAAPGAPGLPPGRGAAGGAGRGGGGRGGAAAAHTPAYWLKVSAERDGTFTVTNPRNGFSKTYRPLD